MGDQQDGGTFLFQDAQSLVPDVIAQPVIKTREGLVHQHDLGPRGQGTRQRHALLFAPRQLMRIAVDEPQQVHTLKQFLDPGAAFGLGAGFQAKAHVVGHAKMRKQREILKHQPDLAPFGGHAENRVTDQLAINVDRTAVLHLDAGDHPQGGRLAAARWPQQTGHLPRHDFQADIIHDSPPAIGAL